MRVSNIISQKGADVISMAAEDTVLEAARLLNEKMIGAVIVCDAGIGGPGIVGIISERDIVRGLAVKGMGIANMPVSEFMTSKVRTCSPEDTIDQVMSEMSTRRVRHLPVVQGEELIGMISIGDVVNKRIAETEGEAEALRQYIAS